MKCNKWTLALAAAGVVSLGSVARADEAAHNQVMTALSSTTLSGYIDTSMEWRPGSNSGAIPGRVFDGQDKMNGFNLNVVGLTLERPLSEEQWSAGYRVDLVFGPDANYFGNPIVNGVAGVGRNGAAFSDFNVQQAYAALRVPVGNGIDVKMGVFDTVVGYEVFESGNDPNFSRSYGFALEPRNHTGILASYHLTDMISVAAGVADTYFGPIDARSTMGNQLTKLTYLGALTITLPEGAGPFAGSAIYGGVVDGRDAIWQTTAGPKEDTVSWYAGTTIKTPLQGLALGAAFDYRQDAAPTAFGGPGMVNDFGNGITPTHNWAWAAAGYASYALTEKFKVNGRADFTQGSDGTFYDGGVMGVSDRQNDLMALTLTADYSLWQGLLTRAEVRWDHALNGDRPFVNTTGTAANRNALTVAADMVYKF